MGLRKYQQKRNFRVTAEPAGKAAKKARKGARFIIQKHDATRLHYDFRLEADGVLKSWAVPKGLPWAQAEKHLAVEVEDHPVEYADFEGIIPKGQYGGGTVMVWDRGSYEITQAENAVAGIRAGKFHVILHGEKVDSEWAMIRIRSDSEKNQWLLMKTGGPTKPISKKLDDQSVKTGRTMKQIASAADAEWQSNRGMASDARAAAKKAKSKSPLTAEELKKLPKKTPQFVEPMKPQLRESAPSDEGWVFELKFDGIRALVIKKGRDLRLLSRNRKNLTERFAAIANACAAISGDEFVVDGEIVALDEEGRSSFPLLQRSEMDEKPAPLVFYAFDLLQWNGRDLRALPLHRRKEILPQLLPTSDDTIRFSDELGGDAARLLSEVKRLGLEGIIGKRNESVYEEGRRSGAWIKLKCVNEQEFVIGGYTPPAGARKHFGALLVGYYKEGKLIFAGKVGTGFDQKMLASMHWQLKAKARATCPFANLPEKNAGQWSQGITPSMMEKMHWINPVLVGQVKFAEWTHDGKLRQPVFLGLRADKAAKKVMREKRG